MRYLARVWPHRHELKDLRQDVYVRVFESALKEQPATPKAFLFATARNLVIDRIRRSRIISIDAGQDLAEAQFLVDELSPERLLSGRQELRRLTEAFDRLSDKCRAVVWLRRVEGISQKEAAARLGMREGAVESQLVRGARYLADAVFNYAPRSYDNDERGLENDSEHG